MSWPIGIAIYFICWWLSFFIMLPFGVRAHHEEGEVEPGFADSAPIAPRLGLKVLGATVLSAIIFGAAYYVIAHRLIPLDKIPMSL